MSARRQAADPVRVRWEPGGRLVVPSRTHEGREYVTDVDGGCSCPRGYQSCWHKTHRKTLLDNAVKALADAGIPGKQITAILSRCVCQCHASVPNEGDLCGMCAEACFGNDDNWL